MEEASTVRSAEFDWDSGPVSEVVVKLVGTATETEATELPPIANCVDPDALDQIFNRERKRGSVMFPYAGCQVTVYAHGEVEVDTDHDI